MVSQRAVKLAAGCVLLPSSVYLYLLYQQTEILLTGVLSILAFAVGSYSALSEVGRLKSLRKVLPFMVIGGSLSLALVALGLSSDVAGSYYATIMSLFSARLTSILFGLTGTPVLVSGDVLTFPNGMALSVGPLCSGAYSSILFMLLSLVMVADVGRSAPRKKVAVVVVVGLVGANLANVFRIAFLASVMYVLGLGALDVVHQFAGYAVFLAFISAFWIVSLRWLRAPRPVSA
jgi:exosortase/archaeosortase family protein